MCEWIAANSNPMYLERWEKIPVNGRRVSTEVHFYNPEPHCISVDFQANDYPRYKLDGESTVVSVDPVKVIFPASLRRGLTCMCRLGRQLEVDLCRFGRWPAPNGRGC